VGRKPEAAGRQTSPALVAQSYELGGEKRLGLLSDAMAATCAALTVMLNPSQARPPPWSWPRCKPRRVGSGSRSPRLDVRTGEDIQAGHRIAQRQGPSAVCGHRSPDGGASGPNQHRGVGGGVLPTMHGLRDYVASGGLMSYGSDFADLYRRAGDYGRQKSCAGTKAGRRCQSSSRPSSSW